ncbi:MAG: methyltransferase domain-containing protein [Sphingomonas sp.]
MTAFEVMEHTPNPRETIAALLPRCADDALILIGTQLSDGLIGGADPLAWYYAAPRNGHISLLSRGAMEAIADRLGLTYASVSRGLHLFSRGAHSRLGMQARLLKGALRRKLGLVPS